MTGTKRAGVPEREPCGDGGPAATAASRKMPGGSPLKSGGRAAATHVYRIVAARDYCTRIRYRRTAASDAVGSTSDASVCDATWSAIGVQEGASNVVDVSRK